MDVKVEISQEGELDFFIDEKCCGFDDIVSTNGQLDVDTLVKALIQGRERAKLKYYCEETLR